MVNKKRFFFVKLGIFCPELEKKHTFGIEKGSEFWPQNQVIEGPDTPGKYTPCMEF